MTSDPVAQFTAQVERFVTSPHVNLEEPIARYLAAVAPRADEHALDVACGPGLLAKAFAPRVASYTGVDLTPAMVERARRTAAEAGLAGARFGIADAFRLPFADGAFDLVLSRLALHHMRDPGAALVEMARVLRPGGRLGLFDMVTSEDPDEAALHHRAEVLRDPSHARALPLSEMCALLGRAARLDVDRVERVEHDLDVDDWIARAEQSPEGRAEARALIDACAGTRRFGGKAVRRDEAGHLFVRQRWAIVVASRPGG